MPLLIILQSNLEAVNDAYNNHLIEEEDYKKTIWDLIDSFDNFNNIGLVKQHTESKYSIH